jgi:biotin carboxyl carrier protein
MSDVILLVGDRRVETQVTAQGNETVVRIGGRDIRLRLERLGPTEWRIADEDGAAHVARAVDHAGTRWLHIDGEIVAVRPGDAVRRRAGRAPRPEGLESPMPGTVMQVAVQEGDAVAAGQAIVVVEAMKMEHVIRAPEAGRVVALRVRAGDRVDAGAVVAELQSSAAPADEPQEPPP